MGMEEIETAEFLGEFQGIKECLLQKKIDRIIGALSTKQDSNERGVPLLGREAEFEKIEEKVTGWVLAGKEGIILLHGASGLGKTSLAKMVSDKLVSLHSNDISNSIYISCGIYRNFTNLVDVMHNRDSASGHARGCSTRLEKKRNFKQNLQLICSNMQKRDKRTRIIIIDEIDLMGKSATNRAKLCVFLRELLKSRLVVIGIANNIDAIRGAVCKLTANYSQICLMSYKYVDIVNIVKDRLRTALQGEVEKEELLPGGVLLLIRKVCNINGDVRYVLDALSRCLSKLGSAGSSDRSCDLEAADIRPSVFGGAVSEQFENEVNAGGRGGTRSAVDPLDEGSQPGAAGCFSPDLENRITEKSIDCLLDANGKDGRMLAVPVDLELPGRGTGEKQVESVPSCSKDLPLKSCNVYQGLEFEDSVKAVQEPEPADKENFDPDYNLFDNYFMSFDDKEVKRTVLGSQEMTPCVLDTGFQHSTQLPQRKGCVIKPDNEANLKLRENATGESLDETRAYWGNRGTPNEPENVGVSALLDPQKTRAVRRRCWSLQPECVDPSEKDSPKKVCSKQDVKSEKIVGKNFLGRQFGAEITNTINCQTQLDCYVKETLRSEWSVAAISKTTERNISVANVSQLKSKISTLTTIQKLYLLALCKCSEKVKEGELNVQISHKSVSIEFDKIKSSMLLDSTYETLCGGLNYAVESFKASGLVRVHYSNAAAHKKAFRRFSVDNNNQDLSQDSIRICPAFCVSEAKKLVLDMLPFIDAGSLTND